MPVGAGDPIGEQAEAELPQDDGKGERHQDTRCRSRREINRVAQPDPGPEPLIGDPGSLTEGRSRCDGEKGGVREDTTQSLHSRFEPRRGGSFPRPGRNHRGDDQCNGGSDAGETQKNFAPADLA